MKPVRALTLSSVLAALSVLLLFLGSFFDVTDLAAVIVASFFVTLVMVECRGAWPWLLYISVSALSFLLLPGRFVSVEYALFGGIWPILKYWLEKLPRLPSFLLKLLVGNALAFFAAWLGLKFFGLEVPGALWLRIAAVVLWEAVLILYDFLITRLIVLWCVKYRARFRRLFR
ncbi:MAG: hypothetical protein IKP55_00435 [Clostridia bacterium]|nr:hypothetical protein [Clostridia bacterium]